MPTDTKLNQLIINQLTQEQYDEAKAAGTLSDTELYITDSDDDALTNNKISNCITEIPQDIKLELNNGTLTLKAGSKVYVPNGKNADGSNRFDEVIINNDLTRTITDNNKLFIFYNASTNRLWFSSMPAIRSGATNPSDLWGFFYNSTDNMVYYLRNGTTPDNATFSLPVATVISNGTQITSIDQVFNGFGYIGSTIFALPGVKGLIPNGRNADGSLKNIKVIQNSVKIMTMASYMAGRKHCPLELFSNNELGGMEIDSNCWGVVATLKDLPRNKRYAAYYCLEDNFVHYFNSTGVESINKSLFAATFAVGDDNKITSFTPKTVFHALDYNDKSTISGWSMPSSQYIDLSLGATGSTYTAPANGWVYFSKTSGDVNQSLTAVNVTRDYSTESRPYAKGSDIRFLFPVSKGDVFQIHYTASSSTSYFRFIYAEGDKPSNVVSSSGSDKEPGGIESGGIDSGDGIESGGIDSGDGFDDML